MRPIALAALLCAAAVPAWGEPAQVGAWTVITTEPDPGRLVSMLTTKDGVYSLDLYCINGPWRLFASRYSERDDANTVSPTLLSYSIDGGPVERLAGTGHKSFRFEDLSANGFVTELLGAKRSIAFAIEPAKKMTTLRLQGTREAFTPFFQRCPLGPH